MSSLIKSILSSGSSQGGSQASLTTIPEILFPEIVLAGTGGTATNMLNGATERFAWAFEAPITGSLAAFNFRVAGITTGCTISASVQDVAANGFPSGTPLSAAGTVVVGDADDNTWKRVAFGAAASLTKGVVYYIVLEVSSGTPSALQGLFYGTGSGGVPLYSLSFSATYNGSAWAYASTNTAMAACLEYSGSVFPFCQSFVPGVIASSSVFSNSSNPDCYALKFRVPVDMSLSGYLLGLDLDNAATVHLIQGTTYPALATSVLSNANLPPSSAARLHRQYFDGGSVIDLSPNVDYYLAVEATAASGITITELTLGDANWVTATYYRSLSEVRKATAVNISSSISWSETTTVIPQFGLIVSKILGN